MNIGGQRGAGTSARSLGLGLALAPMPAMASDFPGMLTVFVGLPLLLVATLVLAVLLIFRRHGWARALGILCGVPVLLGGVYIACVDTWRFWPSVGHNEFGFRLVIILGCALLWLCVLALLSLFWKTPPRRTTPQYP